MKRLNRKLFAVPGHASAENGCTEQEESDKNRPDDSATPVIKKNSRLYETSRPLTERQQLAYLLQITAAESNAASVLKTPQTIKAGTVKQLPPTKQSKHLNKRNERGETLLHIAAIRGDVKKVKRLIRLGADVNSIDFAGWTPLHEACNYGWHSVAQLLLKAGADANVTGLDDVTPLHDAAINGHCDLVKLLLQYGAKCSSKTVHGRTPLSLASESSIIEALQLEVATAKDCTTELLGAVDSAVAADFFHNEGDRFPDFGGHAQQLTSPQIIKQNTVNHDPCFNNMRKSSPQHQTPKGPDKPSSPRLTLRFQPIRSRDDRHGGASKTSEVSSSEPRYQSYCVTMETGEDVYGFKKEDTPVSSTRSSSSTPDSDAYDSQLNVVSSSKDTSSSSTALYHPHHPHTNVSSDGAKDLNSRPRSVENHAVPPTINSQNERHKMDRGATGGSENEVTTVAGKGHPCGKNGESSGGNGGSSSSSNHVRPDYDDVSDGEQEDGRKKRKRDCKDNIGELTSKTMNVVASTANSTMSMSLRNHSRDKTYGSGSGSAPAAADERKSPPDTHQSTSVSVSLPSSTPSFKISRQNSGSETESTQSDVENEAGSGGSQEGTAHGLPKVPPLKIVIPPTSLSEQDRDRCRLATRQALPYVVNASGSGDSSDSKAGVDGNGVGTNCSGGGGVVASVDPTKDDGKLRDSSTGQPEERSHRVTRSSQRMAALANASTSNFLVSSTATTSTITTTTATTTSSSASSSSSLLNYTNVSDCGSVVGHDLNSGKTKYESGDVSAEEQGGPDVPPRKRKLRTRDGQSSEGNSVGHSGSSASSSGSSASSHCEDQSILNCYEMYLNIRRQIDRRRRNMFVVHPKPPQGFNDYLMNRCSYVLAGNAASRLSVPMIPPPQSLTGSMKELFVSQERERYNLRLQHLIEKEKLVLTVEQEILRVHGRAARAMANQTVPLSVCTILKDEEVYNQIESEQEEKERNARTRFTGRHLLSWLQDVDDKWEKVKEAMLLRHHNEAESLHAAQKLDWEWKMKELGICDFKSAPVIDVIHVPIVNVSDDFGLLPA